MIGDALGTGYQETLGVGDGMRSDFVVVHLDPRFYRQDIASI